MLQFLLVRCRRFARPHGSALSLSAGRSPNWNLWSVSWNCSPCPVLTCFGASRLPSRVLLFRASRFPHARRNQPPARGASAISPMCSSAAAVGT